MPKQRAPAALLLLLLAACGSLGHQRTSPTGGTFEATGFAMTILAVDLPKTAEQIARENASDSNLSNLQVTEVLVTPYLGPFDWILDIFSFRYARIRGTWGFPEAESTTASAPARSR